MKIRVTAGYHHRHLCPVTVTLPETGSFQVQDARGRQVPATSQLCESGTLLTFLIDSLPAGETAEYTVTPGLPRAENVCRDDGDRVKVTLGGRPYTEYYYGDATVKPYLGPLYGPHGEQITRLNFAEKEHVHHRSLWISHGDVNGVDTWNEPEGVHGRIRNHGRDGFFAGGLTTGFTARNTWTDFGGKPLLEECTRFTFYGLDDMLLDVEITLTAAYGAVTLGPTKEAGPIAVRMNYNLTVDNTGTIENGAGGINEGEIWMKRAPWCDYYGTEAGHVCGIAILDNPDNERYPSYWHSRNYGLMAPNNYYVGGARELAEGESVTFRYRIIAHSGTTAQADIPAQFQNYAYPPTAELVED